MPDIGQQLCEALDLDPASTGKIEISVHPNEVPTVTVQRFIGGEGWAHQVFDGYELRPVGETLVWDGTDERLHEIARSLGGSCRCVASAVVYEVLQMRVNYPNPPRGSLLVYSKTDTNKPPGTLLGSIILHGRIRISGDSFEILPPEEVAGA